MIRLTATELPRFVQCNGFLQLDKVDEFDKDTTLRDEGDAAHWVCETVFKGEKTVEELIDKKAPNGYFVDAEMIAHCLPYIDAIKGRGEVEADTSYSDKGWAVAGRTDHRYNEGLTLYIDDFKFGYRIVEPDENWTLLSHAIEYFVNQRLGHQNIQEVVLRIFQPRAIHPVSSIREWKVSVDDLFSTYWFRLLTALDDPSKNVTTGSNCYRCASFSLCPAATISTMTALESSSRAFNAKLTPSQTSQMLDEMKRAQEVIKQALRAHEDSALHEVRKGVSIPNYSGVTNQTSPKWKEGVTAEAMEAMTGKKLSKKTIITPTQAVAKGVSEEIIKQFSERKTTGLKLIRVSDSEQARKMFGDKK
tara:strand:+ start:383 stop:1468 length:1086 start_codon:yes stop_codon:yes gene_type:complete